MLAQKEPEGKRTGIIHEGIETAELLECLQATSDGYKVPVRLACHEVATRRCENSLRARRFTPLKRMRCMRCKRVVLSDISTLCFTAAAKDLTYMRQDRVRQSIYAHVWATPVHTLKSTCSGVACE